ncbi:MAG: tolB protein precursor protein [Myxococcaceae bacterium]|nr:tolB protein precursor protein [Myxococcaceae bacterium]
MTRRTARGAALWGVLMAALCADSVQAQVYVYPRRPNKSQVRYYDFNWKHVDILVGPDADTSKADDLKRRVGPTVVSPPDQAGPTEAPHVPTGESGTPTQVEQGEGQGVGFGAAQGETLDGRSGAAEIGNPEAGPEATADGGTPQVPDGGVPDIVAPDVPFATRTLPPPHDPRTLLGRTAGGVRLYFYEREREVAERAAALIVRSYVYLVGQFNYVPTQTFPYILYSSYQEFLQTNLFPLQEGVLGVTSPVDLKLTLPYFGDHELFEEVSAHEMAHQFTIQKIRSLTENAELFGDPLQLMPLWFVEGLAEYYAKRGIDDEAEMMVRDIVIHPDFGLGYTMLDFFEDRPFSVLWTYKVGQVRCAFLEETYGQGTIQRILEDSPRLVGDFRGQAALNDFPSLLARLTGDDPKQISARFEAWLKRRAYRTYLSSQQGTQTLQPLEGFDEAFVDALASSPDGTLIALRWLDLDTGASRLTLIDPRAPTDDTFVAIDGVPGVESLHPVWGRNFALSNGALAWVAESGGSDVVYWQTVEHEAHEEAPAKPERVAPAPAPPPAIAPGAGVNGSPIGAVPTSPPQPDRWRPEPEWDVRIRLGARQRFDLAKKGLIAAYSPAFSPDGRRLALIGFDPSGRRDVYVLDPDPSDPAGFRLTRITHDDFSERQVTWGPRGLVYNSDATAHGRYNLFRVDPAHPGEVARLTTEARDHLDPVALADGRVLFTAWDRGRADVHEVREGTVIRRTDVTTGLFNLSPGPNQGLWALYHHAGRRKPVFVPARMLETLESLPQPASAPPRTIPQRALADAQPYRALSPRNWELGPPFGFIGGGTGGIYGQVVASASDKLRNHALLLNAAVLGSFELTDGYLVYLNQEHRLTWGTGLFSSLVFRLDRTLADIAPDSLFVTTERFAGALGSLRFPFDQFVYVQGDVSVGAVNYFATDFQRESITTTDAGGNVIDLFPEWSKRNGGVRFQTEATLRFGYDTIRYSVGGPIDGSSFLLEGTGDWQPFQHETFGTLRLDAERYFPIYGRTHFFLRAGFGTTFGGELARQFALSTFDTIRGIPYGAFDHWTVGRHFFFSTAELQVPLNALIRVLILTDIEAIAGIDFGGVGPQSVREIWDQRVLSPVVGVNFGLGPLILRLHFAKPLDIGAPAGLPNGNGDWVTNFSIRILGYEGLFDRRSAASSRGLHERPTTFVGERFR